MATKINSTSRPCFDKSKIMRLAWAIYRDIHASYGAWQIARGIVDGSFAGALRNAWKQVKEEAASAAREARLMASPNAARAVAIREEIAMLPFKSLRIDTVRIQQRLEAELDRLAA